MKIRWLSHSCFEIKVAAGADVTQEAVAEKRRETTILIDPYFSGNTFAPKYKERPDFVLVTHEHFDHMDAGKFDCNIITTPSVVFDSSMHPKIMKMKAGESMNIGGVKLEMVASSHRQSKYPAGFVITAEGKRLYHPGDTYLDGVQAVAKRVNGVDVFFVPIGGTYTMDVDEAVEAVKLVQPKLAIPMHYNTFPQIEADPMEFKKEAEAAGFKVRVLNIGEEIEV